MSETQKAILALLGAGGMFVAGLFTGGEVKEDKQPETPAISADCPDGWADTSKEVDHAIVLSCEKDDWLVILHSDRTFSHGLQKNTPGAQFVFDERGVPGWPD